MSETTKRIEVKGKRYLVNSNNELVDRENWDHAIRDWLAEQYELTLKE